MSNGTSKTFGNFTATDAFNAGKNHTWNGTTLTKGSWSGNTITVTATDPDDRTKSTTVDATSRYNAGVTSGEASVTVNEANDGGRTGTSTHIVIIDLSNGKTITKYVSASSIWDAGY